MGQQSLFGEKLARFGKALPEQERREEWDLWNPPKGESTVWVDLDKDPVKVGVKKFGNKTKYVIDIDVLTSKEPEEIVKKQWMLSEYPLRMVMETLAEKQDNKLKVMRTGEGLDTRYDYA